MRTSRFKGLVASLVGVGMLALVGCSNTGGESNNQAASTLTVGATLAPDTIDLTATTAAGGPQALLYNVYETLVKLDGEGKLVGLLASQWTISPDRKTYTFSLRSGETFSTGDPVNAQAVVDSINYVRKSKALAAQQADVASVAAPDAQTVTVTLTKPSQFWLYHMAGAAGIVMNPKTIGSMATESAGSGPYVFQSQKKGDSLTLTRNAKYWGNQAHFGTVTFKYYTDANSLTTAMKAGDINVISDLTTPDALNQFSDTSKYTVVKGTSNGEVVMGFNHASPKMANLKVRQAINYAIDRKALLDSVWGGQGTLIGSMVPPTDPYYEDLSGYYKYDPAKAKQLLAEAGVKNLTLSLRVPNISYATGAAQFVAAQLKAVGITANVEQLDFQTWYTDVYLAGKYDMTIVNHVEPKDIVNWANKDYYWHYNNPEFNKLVAEADQADDAQFVALMKQAAKILATDAAADFLFLFPHLAVCDADISGITANSLTPSFDLTTMASRNS